MKKVIAIDINKPYPRSIVLLLISKLYYIVTVKLLTKASPDRLVFGKPNRIFIKWLLKKHIHSVYLVNTWSL